MLAFFPALSCYSILDGLFVHRAATRPDRNYCDEPPATNYPGRTTRNEPLRTAQSGRTTTIRGWLPQGQAAGWPGIRLLIAHAMLWGQATRPISIWDGAGYAGLLIFGPCQVRASVFMLWW